MSKICVACSKRESNQCGMGTCQVRVQRTIRAISRHEQRLAEAKQLGKVEHISKHQQAIDRLKHKLA